MIEKKLLLFAVMISVTGFACGETASIKGRVVFGDRVSLTPNTPIVVQCSSDSFSTITARTTFRDPYGLITNQYEIPNVPKNTDVTVRAFQDLNGNGTWDSGEPSGRYDGTTNGNATHTTVRINGCASCTIDNPDDVSEIDFFLDSMTAI